MKTLIAALFAFALIAVAVPETKAQSVGNATILNAVTLSGAATNTYTVGGTNQVYIGASDFTHVGLGAYSRTAIATTNTGTITLRLAKSVDGVTAEATPSVTIALTINSTNNNQVITALDAGGLQGYFVTAVESPNSTTTNYVTLNANLKSPKLGAIPATAR